MADGIYLYMCSLYTYTCALYIPIYVFSIYLYVCVVDGIRTHSTLFEDRAGKEWK
jgi:hypothetical protein